MKMKQLIMAALFLAGGTALAQQPKPESYFISREQTYTFQLKSDKPAIELQSVDRIRVEDHTDDRVVGDRIDYVDSFETISGIEAYSMTPAGKKKSIGPIGTHDREIDNIFVHDIKYKWFYFPALETGSTTYSSYRKSFRIPQLIDDYYFHDRLPSKLSRLTLRVQDGMEIGYVVKGSGTDRVKAATRKEDGFTVYTWEMTDLPKEQFEADGPNRSYYSPHVIFYLRSYRNSKGEQAVLGTVDNLYAFYRENIGGINQADETALKAQTDRLVSGISSDSEKVRAIFDYVQSNVRYVAFEDGMGGFVPREAADVFQKKYGDCKDMANLLNQMLRHAGIESWMAWIGTRDKNYRYEETPTPLVDNHMIAVAKVDGEYRFLDATGQYVQYPGFTPFIQGKQAMIGIDDRQYRLLEVPVIDAEKNNLAAKVTFAFDGQKMSGHADMKLTGFSKMRFNGHYRNASDRQEMIRNYLSRFITTTSISNATVSGDDLSQQPMDIRYDFALDKWMRAAGDQLLFKPVLFFPYADSRVDAAKRNEIPVSFDFKNSYDLDYEFRLPDGYAVDFVPENFRYDSPWITADIAYAVEGRTLKISQKIRMNALLVEKGQFEGWNNAIKALTKQYNQNVVLVKS